MTMIGGLFLDRDGVLIPERGDYNFLAEQSILLPDVGVALAMLKPYFQHFIVITNQSGVSKGLYSHDDVSMMHNSIQRQLAEYEVQISDFYYCPHAVAVSKCFCRKPDGIMIEKALSRFHLPASKSVMMGDMERDILAGLAAGVHTVKITSNDRLEDFIPEILEKIK